MAVSPRRIEIHIEEIVLHGVPPSDRHAVADALQVELAALVARHGVEGLLARPDALAHQTPPRVAISEGARLASVGREVARAIHRGWR